MHVLVTGASGFLGSHIAAALRAAGHDVVAASRRGRAGHGRPVAIDFATMRTPDAWAPHLRGVDAVVNAVGILRERGAQTFAALHAEAPRALFDACVTAGVRRVIQVSALGADDDATTEYHRSKRAADHHLLALPLQASVVMPSLVYGPGGASARLFGAWATLPVVPLPGRGAQPVQPIHVDDVVGAVLALLGPQAHLRGRIALVGPAPLAFGEFLATLREALGQARGPQVAVPMPLVRAGVAVAAALPGSLVDAATLSMLERGNQAPAAAITRVLGRPPRAAHTFAGPDPEAARTAAVLAWSVPLLRASLAAVWIVTGVLSLGIFPVDQSLALLARLGLHGVLAEAMLYGAAVLDLAVGLALLFAHRPRWLWAAQAAVIAGYTVLISVWLPEFWLHPFGPILKNLPMLAAIAVLSALERGRPPWTT